MAAVSPSLHICFGASTQPFKFFAATRIIESTLFRAKKYSGFPLYSPTLYALAVDILLTSIILGQRKDCHVLEFAKIEFHELHCIQITCIHCLHYMEVVLSYTSFVFKFQICTSCQSHSNQYLSSSLLLLQFNLNKIEA